MKSYSVRLPDGQSIDCAPGQNILDACLAAGVPMPYNCRSGECAECRAVLLDGSVDESPGADPAVFTQADRDKGRILTCLCAPTSDLSIDIVLRDGIAAPKIERLNALVERIEQVSASVFQVELETPWDIDYRAGQYFEWGLPGIAPNRSYSAANRPGSGRIIFDVRLYEGGMVSDFVRTTLSLGSAIELIGPYGHFGFSENKHRPAICVAGGTGLAPIKAMIEEEIAGGSSREIKLLYGTRRQEDLYDIALLDRWAAAHDGFSYALALSAEPSGSGWTGAIGLVTELLEAELTDAFGYEAYLCGPPPMIDAATPALKELGLMPDDIFADRFSPAHATGPTHL